MIKSPPGKGAMRKSLATFAQENPAHHDGNCWVCGLPERDEVDAAKFAGVGQKTIYRWLAEECGYNGQATYGKVNNHCQRHVRGQSS